MANPPAAPGSFTISRGNQQQPATTSSNDRKREADHRQATGNKTRERSTSPGDSSGNAQPPNRPRPGPS